MSWFQRMLWIMMPSRYFKAVEAESRLWMAKCDACGYTQSLWERGGVRWKAAGEPRTHLKCPQCGKRSWHKIFKV